LARVRPKDLGHLKSFRGINKGEIAKSGDRILDIIHSGGDQSIEAPQRDRIRPPSTDESRVIDLIRVYIGLLSDVHQIASKHLLNTKNLLALVRSKAATREELVTQGHLTHGAAELVGEDILAVLRGERSFRLVRKENGSVKIEY